METRPPQLRLLRPGFFLIPIAVQWLVACESIKIDVGTKEPIKLDPIKVDVTMTVNVNHHTSTQSGQEKAVAKSLAETTERQRNRMKEVQELKNNRLVGEDHSGLLHEIEIPAGDYGEYVKKTVKDENADRTLLMNVRAEERKVTVAVIQEEIWRANVQNSFKGEWIEVANESGEGFRWAQKE